MNLEAECRLAEHKLRVAGVDRRAMHLAELELQQRQRRPEVGLTRLRRRLGAALVGVGTRLHGAPGTAHTLPDLADPLGAGR